MAKRPFPSFLVLRDQQGNWVWNFAGPGGRVLAASSQAYPRREGCIRAIRLLKRSAQVPVVGREADIAPQQEVVPAKQGARRQATAPAGGTKPKKSGQAARPAASEKKAK